MFSLIRWRCVIASFSFSQIGCFLHGLLADLFNMIVLESVSSMKRWIHPSRTVISDLRWHETNKRNKLWWNLFSLMMVRYLIYSVNVIRVYHWTQWGVALHSCFVQKDGKRFWTMINEILLKAELSNLRRFFIDRRIFPEGSNLDFEQIPKEIETNWSSD